MMLRLLFPWSRRSGISQPGAFIGVLALVVIGSLAIAVLPLEMVMGSAIVLAVLIGTVLESGIGFIVTLLVGPWAAWLNTYYPGLLPIDAGQIMFALTLMAWGMGGLARREFTVPQSPLSIPLLIFTGWAAVTMLWAPDLKLGLTEVVKWIEIVLAMWFAIDFAGRRGIQWIVIAVLLTMTLQTVIGIYEARLRGSGPLGFQLAEGVYRAYGTFEQPNPFAGFIGIGLPMAIVLTVYGATQLLRKRPATLQLRPFAHVIGCGLITLLLATALYLSFSRGAWLGAATAIGVMIASAPRRLWIGIGLLTIALALLVGLSSAGLLSAAINARLADAGELFQLRDVRGADVTAANYALIDRQARWQAALNMLADQPWTGIGFGNYPAAYEQYRLMNWPTSLGHAHNIYLNVAAETGLPGLAAYVFLWVVIVGRTFQTIRRTHGLDRALAIGLLGAWTYLSVHNLVDNVYVNNTPLLIGTLLGLLVALRLRAYPARRYADV